MIIGVGVGMGVCWGGEGGQELAGQHHTKAPLPAIFTIREFKSLDRHVLAYR